MSRTQQGSSPWYQLDGAADADEFHIVIYPIYSNIEKNIAMNPAVLEEGLRFSVDFDDAGFIVQEKPATFKESASVQGT